MAQPQRRIKYDFKKKKEKKVVKQFFCKIPNLAHLYCTILHSKCGNCTANGLSTQAYKSQDPCYAYYGIYSCLWVPAQCCIVQPGFADVY